MYIKFPFLNNYCCDFIKKELGNFLSLSFPQIDFKFIFFNSSTIKGLLNHKEKLQPDLRSGLVYLYECSACSATYVGQTKKCLKTRVGDHFGVSPRTGCLLARPTQSAIRDHVEICDSGKSIKDFKCLRTFSNNTLLKIYESLEIHFRKPALNTENSSIPLFLS